MRKQTTNSSSEAVSGSVDGWLDLERLAQVEITSEAPNIRSSPRFLIPDRGPGVAGIVPDISGGGAYASLAQVRLA
jgi:hypothetical protein